MCVGIYTIRKSVTNHPLPSPRIIGNVALQHTTYNPAPRTLINSVTMMVGEIMVSDASRREMYQNGIWFFEKYFQKNMSN